MTVDFGVILAAVAALVFYFRLIRVQRRIGRREVAPAAGSASPGLIRRWPPAVAGVLLAVGGALLAGTDLAPVFQSWWWIPVTLGFVALQFSV